MKREINNGFDVMLGFDMETDVGSFTTDYEGVRYGTKRILKVLKRYGATGTFFWTGHAAENNPTEVRRARDAGHEVGCHGLVHETLGDPIFPLPNNWPMLPSEVEGRLRMATKLVRKVSGVRPVSFRCPRLWGSTQVVKVLTKLGYVADASLPMYYYTDRTTPYHPSARDWTKKGRLKIVEIPNFCDLDMVSKDPIYHRDRDQWPLFRTKSGNALLRKVDGFVEHIRKSGEKPVVCLYFHPWEFHEMPQGAIDYGEASVRPLPMLVRNCGQRALKEFDAFCGGIVDKGGRFRTARDIAGDY